MSMARYALLVPYAITRKSVDYGHTYYACYAVEVCAFTAADIAAIR